jgi:hypothetical protein
MGRAPYHELPPEEIAMLAADPALRARYCELALTMLLPPLRRITEIFATKYYLNESVVTSLMDPLLPGIGREWKPYVATLSGVFYDVCNYTAQFESLARRWEQECYDLLQPDSPGAQIVMMFIIVEQLKLVGKKELELVGISSGSNTVSGGGGAAFMNSGVASGSASAGAQTMET